MGAKDPPGFSAGALDGAQGIGRRQAGGAQRGRETEPVELARAVAEVADAGEDDRGRIAEWLRADLLVVGGDPTRNIRDTREIVGIWRRGVRLDRNAGGDEPHARRRTLRRRITALYGGVRADAASVGPGYVLSGTELREWARSKRGLRDCA